MGGLATGLSSMHEEENSLWVGWSGVPSDDLSEEQSQEISERLRTEYKSVVVDLSEDELAAFYYGFCNNTVWPLFHYFPTYAEYTDDLWQAYYDVNRKFFHKVMEVAEDEDYIWVHDYQLMLLPGMLKAELPHSSVGFFLHIPFPSYEVFRLLPWREELLRGLLGSDLIGFHTYDYARHFLSSVRRILGAEHHMGNVKFDNRMIRVDAFPMGIDYQKYASATENKVTQDEMARVREELGGRQLILSVDRLDYSKGIPLRLKAFHTFLSEHPEYREKVTMFMIVAPSRTQVPHYIELKREIDELVSAINGEHATIGWTPVWYYYRPFPFDKLTALYALSDVLLVTPLRDGMNLISKEYIAARTDNLGTVVLSETAGSARELGEALSVNPNNIDEIANTILEALQLPKEQQIEKNKRMHQRLRRYDIHYWAHDFMEKLRSISELQQSFRVRRLSRSLRNKMIEQFQSASRRLLLVDYDGTLIRRSGPGVPDQATKEALRGLSRDSRNEVVIISGRQKDFLDRNLEGLPVNIVAGHGIWIKDKDGDWTRTDPVTGDWKELILPMLELYQDRTPGSRIEENEFSLVWYYERAQPELAMVRLSELKDALLSLTENLDLSVLEGNKFLEIKNSNVSKGRAAARWITEESWDFVMAVGDDWTDEDIFTMVPDTGYSIKVGVDISSAHYFLESVEEVRELVQQLAGER